MIGEAARPGAISAIERRLAAIGPIDPLQARPIAGGSDLEEALRQLMVRHFPSAVAMTADQREQVCELFIEIAGAARTADVRFLDAFNLWFEAVDSDEAWSRDPRWRIVRQLYADALGATMVRLTEAEAHGRACASAIAADAEPAGASNTEKIGPRIDAKVLILADHWLAGFRLWRIISRINGVRAHCLICNNASAPSLRFAARQAAAAMATGVAGVITLGVALVGRRVRFAAHRLHDDRVTEWIRRQRFSIGLHGMGVIYRPSVLAAFQRGLLNSHIGLLPEYRGRSVMEWSILAGAPTGITVFFMDAGIDTGREIVLRRAVDVSGPTIRAAKESLFRRDGEMYGDALRRLLGSPATPLASNGGGRRYYVMSRLLASVVESLLTQDPRKPLSHREHNAEAA
jgi:folate-dependent phosphoribosylglycinamide formyltransferase PurN